MKREDCSWWRLNPRKGATYTIEFTHDDGGWIRAKLDSISMWEYKRCNNASYAIQMGEQIINEQMRRRK